MLPAVHVDFLVTTPGAWQRVMEGKDSGYEAGSTGRGIQGSRAKEGPGPRGWYGEIRGFLEGFLVSLIKEF